MLTTIMYVTVYVTDQDRALEFYTGGLGLEKRIDAPGARMFSDGVDRHRPVPVDGVPGGMSWRPDGTPLSVIAFTTAEDRITRIHIVVDPAELASIQLPAPV